MSGKIKPFAMAEAGVVSPKQDAKETKTVIANKRLDAYAPTKTSGIKMRGAGAATKGVMCRGPMA
jgi:hypothetical protein